MDKWIAVDWGTSNLRAWAMDGRQASEERVSDEGMGRLAPAEFEGALLRLIEPWLTDGVTPGKVTPVMACGMVGAKQGWQEAPYRSLPCVPGDGSATMPVVTNDKRISVRIAPGLRQDRPADVMRGEETQIAGALALLPGFDGVICLPGTHAKWVQVSVGEVISFQTFMTGEIFALLSQSSVLRHGMDSTDWDEVAFEEGVSVTLGQPALLSAKLFTLRAEGLLHGMTPAQARSRLSGLLIGAELAAAKPYWLGQRVVLVGAKSLQMNYARALAAQGLQAEALDAAACSLAGLTELHLARKATA